jgi:type I restriction enzyme S subunit
MKEENLEVQEISEIRELEIRPPDWQVVGLGKLVSIETGKRMKGGGRAKGEVPSLGGEHIGNSGQILINKAKYISMNFYESLNQGKVRQYDVLLVKDGATTGKLTYVNKMLVDKMAVNEHVFILRSQKPNLLVNFYLYYFLLSKQGQEQIQQRYHGLIGGVNRADVESFIIPLPPIAEQKAIAQILSTVQRAKEATEQVIQATKELKKSLMRYLFTYGAVPIDEAENVKLKETEIGIVPQHWKVIRLEEVIRKQIKNGAFIRRNKFGRGIVFLNVADTYNNITVDINKLDRVACTKQELDSYNVQLNDVFFVRSSLKREGVGQCCIVEHMNELIIYDCHLMRVRLDENIYIPKFLAYYSNSNQGKSNLIARSKTTTMTTINQNGLAKFKIPFPSIEEQIKITNILSSIDKKISVEEDKKDSFDSLFKTLLNNLMTGKIRVNNIEVEES